VTRAMHETRRSILRGLIARIGISGAVPGPARFIVKWRHFPVLFCAGAECRHVYSLVTHEEATHFCSPVTAWMACREYGLRLEDVRIVKL
jgi:hypothetical protein